jgi:signal transduction histidine kinase
MVQGEAVTLTGWARANAAVGAFFPATIALLKDALIGANKTTHLIRTVWPWFGIAFILTSLVFAESFVVENSTDYRRSAVYVIYILTMAAAQLTLVVQGWRQMRNQKGITRLELQFLIFALGILGLLLAALNLVGNWFQIRSFNRASIPTIFITYCFIAWAITHHRIFDARQVFLELAQRVVLVAVLCAGVFGLWRLAEDFLPPHAALLAALALACAVAFPLDRRSREWLRLDGEELLAEWRAAVLAAARTESQPQRLAATFEGVVRTLCQAPFAAFLVARDDSYSAGMITLPRDHPGFAALVEAGWATPENLQRRRPAPGLDELRLFFLRHDLGLIVTAARGRDDPSFLLAVGNKATRWPFTYPEVRRVQAVAELMDNILSHARLAAQAALEARIAHLALMSRGLAHDLKNLLTPIGSFLVHTEGRYAEGSAEAEVHGAARRAVRVIDDYVREALFFANRLQPRFEPVDFGKLFAGVREVAAPLAAQRGVALALPAAADPADLALTADAVLLQRLLGNLVRNALEACAPGNRVALACAAADAGMVRFTVADDGCGIAPEHLPRIFEPYFTTKEFGDDVRGFGLGLAICEKIAALHGGTITVRSEPGCGTAMMVDLPAAPPAPEPAPEPSAASGAQAVGA